MAKGGKKRRMGGDERGGGKRFETTTEGGFSGDQEWRRVGRKSVKRFKKYTFGVKGGKGRSFPFEGNRGTSSITGGGQKGPRGRGKEQGKGHPIKTKENFIKEPRKPMVKRGK